MAKKDKPKPPKVRPAAYTRRKVREAGPGTRERTAWERIPDRWQHAICLAFLLLVSLGFFAAVTFGGDTLIGGDTIQWRGGAEAMIDYREQTGSEPLWAPNLFSGMPGYLVNYPMSVPQADSVLKTLREWGAWPWAHFFTLLAGTYLLVFFLTRAKLPAVLAAVAFGLTTYIPIILVAGHNSKFIALAFAPWLLLAFAYTLGLPEKPGWKRVVLSGLLFAIALAVNFRAGHVQITYYVLWILAPWWLAAGIGMVRAGRGLAFLQATVMLAVGSGLALLMVAHPFWAQWEYKAFTTRGVGESGGLAWDYAMRWSQGWGELVTLVVPGAYGGGSPLYWGLKPFTSGPHYVGAITLALAGLALWGVRRVFVTGLAAAGVIMTLFALGEYLPVLNRPAFDLVPLFASFRVPETWLVGVALVVAVLAGIGLYYVGRREPTSEGADRKTKAIYVAFAAVTVLVVGTLAGGALGTFSFERPGEADQIRAAILQQAEAAQIPASDPRVASAIQQALGDQGAVRSERAALLRADALRSLLFLGLGLGLLVAYRRGKVPAWALQAGLVLLVTVDLWGVGRRYFNEDADALRARSSVAQAVPRYGVDTFILERVAEAGGPGTFRTLPLALNPMNSAREAFFYESVGGYHGAKLALYQEYIDELLFYENALVENALDLTAARYVIAQQPLEGYTPVFRDQQTGLFVLENLDALPRASLVYEAEVIEDRDAALERLRDPAFEPRERVVLHERPEGLEALLATLEANADSADARTLAAEPLAETALQAPDSLLEAPDATFAEMPSGVSEGELDDARPLAPGVALIRFSPREIIYYVEAPEQAMLLLSEVYYPAGWTAVVNDIEAPILRADHLLRAVPVPAGTYFVALRFDPEVDVQSRTVSLWATLLVYTGALLLAGLVWYRRSED